MAAILATNALAILLVMLAIWSVSLVLRDVSIVDVAWGCLFVLVAWLTALLSRNEGRPIDWLLPVLTTIWGTRLALYLLWRKWGEGEDHRYATMRVKRGAAFAWQSLFIVFLLQGFLAWTISLPLQFGIPRTHEHVLWRGVGIVLWALGFFFESIGDWQLARFRSDLKHRGQVMDRGLWRYSRHPNYFGDFCVWWGLGLIAVGNGAGLWTLIGPLLITVLLLRVSGVTLLESTLKSSKPGYEEYARRTNAFFPWLPKSSGKS
jgi:steroid 5-alpha reductase family enzyme